MGEKKLFYLIYIVIVVIIIIIMMIIKSKWIVTEWNRVYRNECDNQIAQFFAASPTHHIANNSVETAKIIDNVVVAYLFCFISFFPLISCLFSGFYFPFFLSVECVCVFFYFLRIFLQFFCSFCVVDRLLYYSVVLFRLSIYQSTATEWQRKGEWRKKKQNWSTYEQRGTNTIHIQMQIQKKWQQS